MQNIYELPQVLDQLEKFEPIVSGKNIQIERIISTGQTTPSGQWYDQTTDEWVLLLQGEAELSYLDDSRIKLKAGDYLLIPAHTKHRVEYTSIEPPCIWLAVHGQFVPS
jgi:cupin 2 domain-containing protein